MSDSKRSVGPSLTNSFCGCLPLERGVRAVVGFTVGYEAVTILRSVLHLYSLPEMLHSTRTIARSGHSSPCNTEECDEPIINIWMAMKLGRALLGVAMIVVACLLAHNVQKGKRSYASLYQAVSVLGVLFRSAELAFTYWFFASFINQPLPAQLHVFVFGVSLLLLQIYFVLVVQMYKRKISLIGTSRENIVEPVDSLECPSPRLGDNSHA